MSAVNAENVVAKHIRHFRCTRSMPIRARAHTTSKQHIIQSPCARLQSVLRFIFIFLRSASCALTSLSFFSARWSCFFYRRGHNKTPPHRRAGLLRAASSGSSVAQFSESHYARARRPHFYVSPSRPRAGLRSFGTIRSTSVRGPSIPANKSTSKTIK